MNRPGTLVLGEIDDADPGSTAADYAATADWGDGSSTPVAVSQRADGGFEVTGSHGYGQTGSFPVSLTVAHAGSTATALDAVAVGDVLEGQRSTLTVAAFSGGRGSSPSDYTATIDWGDGTTGTGTVTGSADGFQVSGDHAYAIAGGGLPSQTFTVGVSVADAGGEARDFQDQVRVVRPAAEALPEAAVAAAGLAVVNGEVAAFAVADTQVGASAYSATIAWGDGTTGAGTVTGAGGLFRVLGSHRYAAAGTYPIEVALLADGAGQVAGFSVDQAAAAPTAAGGGMAVGAIIQMPAATLTRINFASQDGQTNRYDILNDGTGNRFEPNQWEKQIGAARARANPVAYVRNTALAGTATFVVSPFWKNADLTFAGRLVGGPGGALVVDSARREGTTYLVRFHAATNFAQVAAYADLATVWGVTAAGRPNALAAGASANKVYVLFDAPLVGAPQRAKMFETVVAYGSRGILPSATANDMVARIWANFSARTANRADGQALYYYRNWFQGNNPQVTAPERTLAGLLSTLDGQCGAWGQLLYNAMLAQGINSGSMQEVSPTTKNEGFLVDPSKWTFTAANNPKANSPYRFISILGSAFDSSLPGMLRANDVYNYDFITLGGIAPAVTYITNNVAFVGQNTTNPVGAFTNHVLVQITMPDPVNANNTIINLYDPSYGRVYTSLANFQQIAVAGFCHTGAANAVVNDPIAFVVRRLGAQAALNLKVKTITVNP